ncbi:YrhB domain-containing protein [Stenotrophomonas indicatrix]|uniref:YrhB domain-containing protein n=1 Tax=Stenotrophomonas TaxID=40323 RepID=UPI0028A961CF|nr:YrhB domain-containing protein [Stenotrophomonas indicatrix]
MRNVTRDAFAMGRGTDSGTNPARLSGCNNASQYARSYQLWYSVPHETLFALSSKEGDEGMIHLEEARRRVEAALATDDEPVVITHEHEVVEGWLFCFQSLRYLQSGEISDALAGNGPIFFDRHTGDQHPLCTACAPEEALRQHLASRTPPSEATSVDF